jgi:outer membrane autotransporter protein
MATIRCCFMGNVLLGPRMLQKATISGDCRRLSGWFCQGFQVAWILFLWLLAGSVAAVPNFSPDPSDVEFELEPGETLTVSITPGLGEEIRNVYWGDTGGPATFTAGFTSSGGTAELTVDSTASNGSTIRGSINVVYLLANRDVLETATAEVSAVVRLPLPTATIEATAPTASSNGSDAGELTVRLGTPAPSGGITVYYSVGGTAVAGTDYQALPGNVRIPAGESSAPIPVEPIATYSTDDKTVVATLASGEAYQVGSPSSATVTILGTVPTATIEATDPTASSNGSDEGAFTVRLGTPAPAGGITVYYGVGGTAVAGTDYQALPGNVRIPAGQSSAPIPVKPIATFSTDDKTVVATLASGNGYQVGSPSSATVTIAGSEAHLSIDSGNGQVSGTGLPLQPFVVKATSNGVVAAGIPIVWTLVTGEGSLSNDKSVTDSNGQASSTLTPKGDGSFVVKAQVQDTSESVEFTTLFNPLSSLPISGNPGEIAKTLDALCPRLDAIGKERTLTSGEQDLLTQCQTLQRSAFTDPDAAVQGVIALTPDQASIPREMALQLAGAQMDNLVMRLLELRHGAKGLSVSNLTVSVDGQSIGGDSLVRLLTEEGASGGAASADDGYQFERLGVFVNGNVDWGNRDQTSNVDGFDFKTLGVTAGMDYRFLDGLVLGVALGYGNSNADMDSNGGDLGVSTWTGMFYGTYYATDHFYLEGSATYGWGSYDQTRNISYGLLGDSRKAKANYDGSQYAFMLGAGYDLIQGAGILDLYGRLRYAQVSLDNYRESGASGLDLNIRSQEATSFKSILGINYTRSISTAKAVLLPQGWLEWAHEFKNGDDEVNGFFANDPNRIAFALATDQLDSDYVRLGLGLGAQFGKGRTAFASYEAAIGLNNYREQTLSLGVRLDF